MVRKVGHWVLWVLATSCGKLLAARRLTLSMGRRRDSCETSLESSSWSPTYTWRPPFGLAVQLGKTLQAKHIGMVQLSRGLLLHKPDLSDDMQDLPSRLSLSCKADLDRASSIIQHYNPLNTHGPRGPLMEVSAAMLHAML